MRKMRTLYECLNARVTGQRIQCRCGHKLSLKSTDGGIDVIRLARGEPLTFSICQACRDFEYIGPPIEKEERGWVNGRRPTKQSARYGEMLYARNTS